MKKIADAHKCAKGVHQPRTIRVYYNNSVLITTSCRVCGKILRNSVFPLPVLDQRFETAKISP